MTSSSCRALPMERDFALPNGPTRSFSHSTSPIWLFRLRLRKFQKRLSKVLSSSRADYSRGALIAITAVLLCFLVPTINSLRPRRHPFFDDVADMRLLEEEELKYMRLKKGEPSTQYGDPLSSLNASEVATSRIAWDYIYGEIVRKPVQPVLTKYKLRLLRELLMKTHYVLTNKFSPAMDVSCNYINKIDDEGSLFSFQCSETSHRCPDGSFGMQSAYAPKEGSSVTWKDVVIVLMVSKGREPYLEAAAETWISRLHPDATIFFSRDAGEPAIPASVLERENTFVYEYPGTSGYDSLDLKAFRTWDEVYTKYGASEKKYFLKIDDDSFLFGHNLIRFLGKMEHWFSGKEQALYFGHPFCGHGDLEALGYATWCYAGGGAYGLSIEALQILVTQIKGGCAYFYDYVAKAPNLHPVDDKYGGRYEDVMVGRCMRQARTRTQQRGTSLLACGSFFPYAPLHYYEKFGKSKEKMASKLDGDIITIHNLEPSAIRYIDHIVYEYPLGGATTPFSADNDRLQELIDVCTMTGKKMSCQLGRVASL